MGNFLDQPESYHDCQLVYTFVLGGNPNGPTELVNNNSLPLLVTQDYLLWIETPEQLETLKQLAVPYGQGYFLGRARRFDGAEEPAS